MAASAPAPSSSASDPLGGNRGRIPTPIASNALPLPPADHPTEGGAPCAESCSCRPCSSIGCTRSTAGPTDPGAATVVDVVDGDTVVVDIAGQQETLRLIGVDTPETVDPDQPPECFGAEASAHTKALLPEGTEVRLTRDVEARDRYDRLLVYVTGPRTGSSSTSTWWPGAGPTTTRIPPNVAHQRDFALAVAQARAEGLGLWATCGNADTPAG